MASRTRRVRYAVVGAGWFGQAAVLPAFANAKENSELAAIVSGDAQKRAVLSADYGSRPTRYEQYRGPPGVRGGRRGLHRQPELRCTTSKRSLAARHRVHVLCEKPLADTAVAAEEMIAACDRAGVLLMTAYRLHFEKANLTRPSTRSARGRSASRG